MVIEFAPFVISWNEISFPILTGQIQILKDFNQFNACISLLFAASIVAFYSLKHILHHPHKSPIDLNGCDFSLYFSIYAYKRKIRSTIIWIFYLCYWSCMNRYTPYQRIILFKTILQDRFSKSIILFKFKY